VVIVIIRRKREVCWKRCEIPVTDDDIIMEITPEFRNDPYKISPSGDSFWADKSNLELIKKAVSNKDQIADKLRSADDVKKFLDSL